MCQLDRLPILMKGEVVVMNQEGFLFLVSSS